MTKQHLYKRLLAHFRMPEFRLDEIHSVDQILNEAHFHHHRQAYSHYMEGVPEILANYIDDLK